jgi:hypothetical protein
MLQLLRRSAACHHRRHVSARTNRSIVTLAIETSCDDTSVAVAELLSPELPGRVKVHFHGESISSGWTSWKISSERMQNLADKTVNLQRR